MYITINTVYLSTNACTDCSNARQLLRIFFLFKGKNHSNMNNFLFRFHFFFLTNLKFLLKCIIFFFGQFLNVSLWFVLFINLIYCSSFIHSRSLKQYKTFIYIYVTKKVNTILCNLDKSLLIDNHLLPCIMA